MSSLSPFALLAQLGQPDAPLIIDVRRETDFVAAGRVLAGSIRRPDIAVDPVVEPPPKQSLVVYCAHGRSVSQDACRRLIDLGCDARYLEGGYAAWLAQSAPTLAWREPLGPQASVWKVAEKPDIDTLAGSWLIRRFIDPLARFVAAAAASPATADPLTGTRLQASDHFELGSQLGFDSLLRHFELDSDQLQRVSAIVSAARGTPDPALTQIAGMQAITQGLAALSASPLSLLDFGLILFDAMHAGSLHNPEPLASS